MSITDRVSAVADADAGAKQKNLYWCDCCGERCVRTLSICAKCWPMLRSWRSRLRKALGLEPLHGDGGTGRLGDKGGRTSRGTEIAWWDSWGHPR